MVDAGLLVGALGLVLSVGLISGALLFDGAYQVATGRQALLPFERMARKRQPASDLDCVLQGVSKFLQALGMTLVVAPSGFNLLRVSSELTGASIAPLSRLPAVLNFALAAGLFGSLLLGLVCFLVGIGVGRRVTYVRTDSSRAIK